MSEPSPAVIEAVERAEREHPQRFTGGPCSCGYAGPLWNPHHRRVEVARAAEAAGVSARNVSRGMEDTPLGVLLLVFLCCGGDKSGTDFGPVQCVRVDAASNNSGDQIGGWL